MEKQVLPVLHYIMRGRICLLGVVIRGINIGIDMAAEVLLSAKVGISLKPFVMIWGHILVKGGLLIV